MTYYIDIQNATSSTIPFSEESLTLWAITALTAVTKAAELSIRIVSALEIAHLNHTYRHQNKPTNVLAFPCTLPEGVVLECPLLGDVVIAPEVLLQESIEQSKSLEAHWAHIIIHGVLHLLGFDHIEEEDANKMQSLEMHLLEKLGYNNM